MLMELLQSMRSILTGAVRVWACLIVGASVACSPKVEVAVPEKPVTINLNVKIEHDIKVRVDKELDDVISDDSELF